MADIDIISDSTGREIVAAIKSTDVAQARISEINQAAELKKNEVLESIPEDYRNTVDEVNQLKGDLDELIELSAIWTEDTYIKKGNGERTSFPPTATLKYWSSDYIDVENLSSLYAYAVIPSTVGGAFYDENKKYIADCLVNGIVNIPSNAKYYRYTKETISHADENSSVKGFIKIEALNGLFSNAQQLFDEHGVLSYSEIAGKFIAENGVIKDFSNTDTNRYFVTDYIEIIPNSELKVLCDIGITFLAFISFYDKSKKFISSLFQDKEEFGIYKTITVPPNAVYCVMCRRESSAHPTGNFYIQMNMTSKDIISSYHHYFKNDDKNPLSKLLYDGGYTSIFRKIGCIGDSLASGEVYELQSDGTYKGSDKYEYSWGQYLARACGSTCYNFSVGGLTAKTWRNMYDIGGNSNDYFTTNLSQAYIIGLGANDRSHSVTVGTSDDINISDRTQNADTFYGNYASIIQYIKTLVPKAKIFVITDPRPTTDTDYNVAIRYMAEAFENVYVIDLWTYAKEDYTQGSNTSLYVQSHLTAVGYKRSAYHIGTYIDWIIRNNLSEFNEVPFILSE